MPATLEKNVLSGLEPAALWGFFEQLTRIPRPSKAEGKVRDWVLGIATKRGWKSRQDDVGNVIINVPATAGMEKAAPLVLQSHLDMVCEKNSDVTFDFDRDALKLRIVGDEVRATGTTLGADNGIGVCSMLALATADGVRHGPLELLFTIDEETGLTGAAGISPDLVRGRRLINLDSEEDDILYIGCAGGRTTTLRATLQRGAAGKDDAAATIGVSGLRGGHSGADIHEGRGNANKLLARLLAGAGMAVRVVSFAGGNKHNAIPREASARVLISRGDEAKLKKRIETFQAEARKQLADVDGGVTFSLKMEGGAGPAALSAEDSRRLIDLVVSLPDGVLGMSRAIPGLVETSDNVAVVATEGEGGGPAKMSIVASSRSSSAPQLVAVLEQVAAAGRLAGWEGAASDGYPGWAPNPHSKLLEVCRGVYEKLFKEPPKVTAIHAGLECGVIGERVGEMDMISFGPTIKNVHSPDECVSIKSVQKFWKYLTSVVEALATS